jgi:hypothetical protein
MKSTSETQNKKPEPINAAANSDAQRKPVPSTSITTNTLQQDVRENHEAKLVAALVSDVQGGAPSVDSEE